MLPHDRTLLIVTFNFTNKSKTANIIFLHRNHQIIASKNISHPFNKYFVFSDSSKTPTLKRIFPALKQKSPEHLLKHLNRQYIQKMQKHFTGREKCAFCCFQQEHVIRVITELAKRKALTFKDTPVKVMFSWLHIFSQGLTNFFFNDCAKGGNFPVVLHSRIFLEYL